MNRDSTSTVSLPATERGWRTRRRLLDAAEVVFGRVGYEAASIADLTREAGVALGTFYVYFPDKKTLFVEVVDTLGQRLRQRLAAAVAGLADRLSVERAGLEAFFDFAHEHRLLYRVVRQAEFVDQECFQRYYRGVGEPYARGLATAMDAGELRRVDPEALAYCLMGLADFLGMRYVLWANGRGRKRALAAATSLLRHGLAAAPATADGASATKSAPRTERADASAAQALPRAKPAGASTARSAPRTKAGRSAPTRAAPRAEARGGSATKSASRAKAGGLSTPRTASRAKAGGASRRKAASRARRRPRSNP